jgi:hypothetical protein
MDNNKKNMIPDCTLSTACFCLYREHENTRTLEETIVSTQALLTIPVYLVIYGDKKTIPLLKKQREQYGLTNISAFIEIEKENLWSFQYLEKVTKNREHYFPSKDSRTTPESHLITCNKFDFVLNTMTINPFNTTKFGWVDSFLGKDNIKICENYEPNILPWILSNITDKFHIQVLNVCDKKYKNLENKREYYSKYQWVVCGGFFTCGETIGRPILNRLKEIFTETTENGHGHGEEMFYLEVLDEFYDDIYRSYGDYGQIWNNFIRPTRNIHYIYYFILKNYLNYEYYKEALDCSKTLLREIESHNIYVIPNMYMNILFDYFISTYYEKPIDCKQILHYFENICSQNTILKREYENEKWRIEWYIGSIKEVFG